jgi:hypothetical protein
MADFRSEGPRGPGWPGRRFTSEIASPRVDTGDLRSELRRTVVLSSIAVATTDLGLLLASLTFG